MRELDEMNMMSDRKKRIVRQIFEQQALAERVTRRMSQLINDLEKLQMEEKSYAVETSKI